MRFEWDGNKNQINIEKHGINFEQVKEIFFDDRSVYVPARIIDGEERVAAIGILEDQKFMFAFTFCAMKRLELFPRAGPGQTRRIYGEEINKL